MFENEHESRSIRVSRWLLDKLLFMNNLDLYRIYQHDAFKSIIHKTPTGNWGKRYQLGGISLQNKSSRWHKNRERFFKLLIIFMTYFSIKTIIVNLVHLALHKIKDRSETCPFWWWPNCKEILLNVRRTIGDPYSEMSGDGIFLAISLVGWAYLFAVMPYYYNTCAFDMATFRFCYEPVQEICRIDRIIEIRLNELFESASNYHEYQYKISRNKPKLFVPELVASITSNQKSIRQIQQQLVSYKRKGFRSLRPNYYDESNRLRSLTEAARIMDGLCFTLFLWIVSLQARIFTTAALTKCSSQRLTTCSLSAAFSWQERIYQVETMIISFLAYLSSTFNCCAILVLLISNSRLVANMKAGLESCLWNLKKNNELEPMRPKRDEQLEKALVENCVKVLVAGEELRRGVRSITLLLVPWFAQVFVLVGLFILINGMSTEYSKDLKRQILYTYWLGMNSFALICARLSSRYIQLQRLYWSIESELIVYHESRDNNNSFLSHIWQRLSDHSRSNSALYIAQPLGIVLSYKKIIEINLSVISLITFLLAR